MPTLSIHSLPTGCNVVTFRGIPAWGYNTDLPSEIGWLIFPHADIRWTQ